MAPRIVVIRSSPLTTMATITQRQSLPTAPATTTVGEIAGGTTANVCLVCCCCPCVLLEFLVLAVYKVPVTVFRRLWRCRRRRKTVAKKAAKRKKKTIVEEAMEVNNNNNNNNDDVEVVNVPHQHERHCQHIPGQHVMVGYVDELSDVELGEFETVKVSIDGSEAAVEMDKQMWDRFRDAGFWRSPSRRIIEDDDN